MSDKFSPQDLDNAKQLLYDLHKEVSSQEGEKSGGTTMGLGTEVLESLLQSKVTFGNPTNQLTRLTPKLFEAVGVELTEIYKRQMRDQFDFYYMTLTTALQPKRGAQFKLVECSLEFGPKGAAEPIVQTIFPKSEWRDVLSWGAGLNLGLNGNLDWGVGIPDIAAAKMVGLPVELQGKIANKNELKAHIAVPDYSFNLGRAEIVAIGEGHSACFWRIEKPDLQAEQTILFTLVFKVPKGTTSIELTGLVAAEPSMAWLTAPLKQVAQELKLRFLKTFLTRKDDERQGKDRLPIGAHEKWMINLPH